MSTLTTLTTIAAALVALILFRAAVRRRRPDRPLTAEAVSRLERDGYFEQQVQR